MTTRTTTILFGLISTWLLATSGWSSPRYRLTDLGPGNLVAMNKQGVVLGADASGIFTYEHGRKQALVVTPTPAIQCFSEGAGLIPEAINDRGDVALDLNEGPGNCLVLLQDGKLTELEQTAKSFIIGLNDHEQFIGNIDVDGNFFGFGANCTTTNTDIYQASALNNRGEVVGILFDFFSPQPEFVGRAALCRKDGSAWIELVGVSGSPSQANAINDLGLVVGSFTTSTGDQHAFLYERNQMIDLDTLVNRPGFNSDASGINGEGEIVGWSDTRQDQEPVVWIDHRPYSLQDSIDLKDRLCGHVRLQTGPIFISDRGEIALSGIDLKSNVEHVYLMTPLEGHEHWR
jgi:probable HAF family extracellular repeat protein